MALHHNASNMHLSLTHCSSPVLKRYWPCNNSCQTCARCQHCVKTTAARMGLLAAFKPQKGLWLKGVRMKHLKVHLASCLYCQYCALHAWSPMQMALLRVIGGGTVLFLSNIGSCSFMPSCKGDRASLRHLLRALSPVYLMSPPHCWSMPTLSRCLYAHQ